jgi:hypothetical protein
MKTTEQLVRDCFCNDSCSCFPCAAPDYYDCPQWKLFSRAARRFVKAEQRHKLHNRIRRQFKGRCEIVAEKGGYNFHDALKRAEQRERKRK